MQCRQLTDARAAFPWLAEGSIIVQQQALRDFHQAWANYAAALRAWRARVARLPAGERPAPPGPPSWRKRGVHEGFRIVAMSPQDMRQLNRHWGGVKIPNLGWVRFRWSRGSTRRGQVKRAVARLYARAADRRTKSAKGTVERPGKRVCQKTGLNRGILGCVACAWTGNADVNAARNIAAGRAVPARGGLGSPWPVNREPHHVASSVA